MGRSGRVVKRRTLCRDVTNRMLPFRNMGNCFTPHSLCLSDDTLTVVGPFFLVSLPGKRIIVQREIGKKNWCGLTELVTHYVNLH